METPKNQGRSMTPNIRSSRVAEYADSSSNILLRNKDQAYQQRNAITKKATF